MQEADGQRGEKRIFISYSHQDRDFAQRLATSLHERGERVWWDEWDLQVGDSLVTKILEEGLGDAAAFLIVLSPHSVESQWVREELDLAMVQKIQGVTRIIPVIKEPVEIPIPLRSLLWLNMESEFDQGVERIVAAVHGLSRRPEHASGESIGTRVTEAVAGFSVGASTVGSFMIDSLDPDGPPDRAFTGPELQEALDLSPLVISDAIEELEERGLVRVLRTFGTTPFSFRQAEPTYVLYQEFASLLTYDPNNDVRVAVAAIAAQNSLRAPELAEITGLSPGRLNRAVGYIEDFGLADLSKEFGTRPFTFGHVRANHRTRQAAAKG